MHGIEIERIRKIDRINWSWTRNWKAAVASIKPGIITLEVADNISEQLNKRYLIIISELKDEYDAKE